MKKLLLLLTLLGGCVFSYGQDNVNAGGSQTEDKDDCAYHINGICASEDIGGVDVEFYCEKVDAIENTMMKITNYNTKPVSVLLKVERGGYVRTFSIVLGVNGVKDILLQERGSCCSYCYNVDGLIVRELKN